LPMKKALVLGGGGARGLAHLGVLRILEKEGFRPDLIVGCSIGAIIGGMYAQTPDIQKVEKRVYEFFESEAYQNLNINRVQRGLANENGDDLLHHVARNLMRTVFVNMVANRQSILDKEEVDEAINFLIKEGNIRDTRIPFACNAVDLVTGKSILFKEGDMRQAIRASSSIPGYVMPVQQNSEYLVDGAVADALPTDYARKLGADFIISVDVSQEIKPRQDFQSVFDIILRANMITLDYLYRQNLQSADLLIRPEVGKYNWYDFQKIDRLIKTGEDAAREKRMEIRRASGKVKQGFFSRLLSSGKKW
jgi:NTE family protein